VRQRRPTQTNIFNMEDGGIRLRRSFFNAGQAAPTKDAPPSPKDARRPPPPAPPAPRHQQQQQRRRASRSPTQSDHRQQSSTVMFSN